MKIQILDGETGEILEQSLTLQQVSDLDTQDLASAPAITDYENAIQNFVDSTARERQFRDGVTLASYIGSSKQKWAAEAQAFINWRDYVWTNAYIELDKVQSGQRQQPTIEEFLSEVVRITWPTS